MNSGRYLGHLFLNRFNAKMAKVAVDAKHEKCSKVSVGYCEPAHHGLIYPSATRPTKRVTGVSKNGRETACYREF